MTLDWARPQVGDSNREIASRSDTRVIIDLKGYLVKAFANERFNALENTEKK